MTDALILAPLLLVGVLAVSGVAKVRDPEASGAAFTALRVPDALAAPWIQRAVPWGELALAVLLLTLPSPLRWLAVAGALGLFVAYTVLIVRAWRAPEQVSCNCFGSAGDSTVTGFTVARNVVLVAASVLAGADAAASGLPPVLRLAEPAVLAWVLMAALVAATTAFVVHRPADAATAATALPPADDEGEYVRLPIPYGVLRRPDGDEVHLHDLARQRAVALVWVSPGCGSCQPVIEALPGWADDLAGVVDVFALADSGAIEALRDRLPGHLLLVDEGWNTSRLFRSGGTPSLVLLGVDGLIAGGPVSGSDAVTDLVDGIKEQLAEAALASSAHTSDEGIHA